MAKRYGRTTTAVVAAMATFLGAATAVAQEQRQPARAPGDAASLPPHVPAPGTVKPMEGLIWRRDNDIAENRFNVHAPANGLAYLISLYSVPDNRLALVMYVSPGESHSVQVAEGTYHLHYDAGLDWYGPEKLFGPDTAHGDLQEYQRFYPGKDSDVNWQISGTDRALFEAHAKTVAQGANR